MYLGQADLKEDGYMEKNSLVIKGSFRGIAGDFLKNLGILLITFVVYSLSNNIKNKYYKEYNIKSFISFVTELDHIDVMAIISFIFLLFIILFFIALTRVYRTIILIYEAFKVITIDYVNGKIISATYSFPFNKTVDENKFDEIIGVSLNQDLMSNIFSTGDLNIEYIVCNKVDSQLKNIEITYVVHPFKIKAKML